jgi:hypothetical protein
LAFIDLPSWSRGSRPYVLGSVTFGSVTLAVSLGCSVA